MLPSNQTTEDGTMYENGKIYMGLADGARVELTYKEFELLRLFLSHPGMAFTRDQLMEKVWGVDYCGETRTVDMHIRTLRQKLGENGEHIETVRGVGYRWEAEKK
jgi:two-component system alkaline phosphatase synthesis response regulator PhoP